MSERERQCVCVWSQTPVCFVAEFWGGGGGGGGRGGPVNLLYQVVAASAPVVLVFAQGS